MTAARQRQRFTWLDAVVIAAVAVFVAYLGWRSTTVLKYHWNWAEIGPFILRWDASRGHWVPNLILQGLFSTIRIAIWSALAAAVIGLAMGLSRVSHSLFLRTLGWLYVELVRNIPPLVFVFVFYFFLTSQITPLLHLDEFVQQASPATLAAIGWLLGQPAALPAIVSAILCLALFEGAYVTEIVRAGIGSIEKGQWEASASLGLSRLRTLRLIVIPQALSRVLPPLAGQFISLVKDSSIVSLISIPELTFLGNEVANSTGRLFEVWITVSLLYFALCFGLSLAFGRIEQRFAGAAR